MLPNRVGVDATINHAWMRKALDLAQDAAANGEVPVGAVVVDAATNALLGSGRNSAIGNCDPTAHAEIMALRDAARKRRNYRLAGTTLYVTLEPCVMCAGALVQARVERLVFGAWEPRTGAIESQEQVLASPAHNHQVAVTAGVMAQECGALMQRFFQDKRL